MFKVKVTFKDPSYRKQTVKMCESCNTKIQCLTNFWLSDKLWQLVSHNIMWSGNCMIYYKMLSVDIMLC